jgi:hypothetical protein
MSLPAGNTLSPPVASILAELTRSNQPQAAPRPVAARILRTSLLVWLLIAACLVMMLLVAGGIAVLGWRAQHLVEEIRQRETRLAKAAEVGLPSDEALLNPERFRALVEAHPREAVRFGCARASALAAAGQREEAVAAWREAAAWSTRGLPPTEVLSLAEILFQLGRFPEAEQVVKGFPAALANDEDRAWAVDLLGRLQLVRLTNRR